MELEDYNVAWFSVPRQVSEMRHINGKIRGKWHYNTSMQKDDQSRILDFSKESLSYVERVISKRDESDLAAIRSVATGIRLHTGVKFICCILCHASEPIDLYNIEGIVETIANCNGHTVIYVNASGSDIVGKKCRLVSLNLKKRLSSRFGHSKVFCVLNHCFLSQAPIGKIRGILTDGVVLASINAGISDPVLVSTDIDFIATAPYYDRILLNAFSNPKLDIISGPVFFGYDHVGNDHTKLGLNAPELFLRNRALYYKKISAAKGLILGVPYNPTFGTNTAYRLSAYCAAGGHRYELHCGEDTYIGSAIFALRSENFSTIPNQIHAVYDPDFWLVTDPRRQLQATVLDFPIDRTWQELPFHERLGSSMRTKDLIAQYHSNIDLIQVKDLVSQLNIKTVLRIRKIFNASIGDKVFSKSAIEFQTASFGLLSDNQGPELLTPGTGLMNILLSFHCHTANK